MRKTKNLANVLKALFLIFALCFLTSTQMDAQSLSINNSSLQATESESAPDSDNWNFHRWVQNTITYIVTIGMSVHNEGINSKATQSTDPAERAGNSRRPIVTIDMSVREPD